MHFTAKLVNIGGVSRPNPILKEILRRSEEFRNQGKAIMAVFDLDSTLLDVSPRIQRIIHDFAERPEVSDPATRELLKAVRIAKTDWGIRQALERAGFNDSHAPMAPVIRDFWREKFFSNEYLHLDQPLPGSLDFVKNLFTLGTEIIYLTGRDEIRMQPGTRESLVAHGFPLHPPRSRLEMKPAHGTEDFIFKEEWFRRLPKDGYSVIWLFENEPLNIQSIREHHPEVEVIFVDTTHAGKAPKPEDLPTIRHFIVD